MKLDQLYSLRTGFTVIGLTGRTGSGCTKIAERLAGTFEKLSDRGLRDEKDFTDKVFERKYSICRKFLSYPGNWQPYEVIRYTNVLLFFLLHKYGGDSEKTKKLFIENFKLDKAEDNTTIVDKLMNHIKIIDSSHAPLIKKIKELPDFSKIKSDTELKDLHDLFFSKDFAGLTDKIFEALERYGYFRTRLLLHWVSCNIRSSGDPLGEAPVDVKNIFTIAQLMNRLIKGKRFVNTTNNKPTKVVIDSLRNSLEIMFFKERYSAFYMVATKDVIGNTKNRLDTRLKHKIKDESEREKVIEQLLELDEIEYRTKDFAKGKFSSPDVENCIQKSDFHIFNLMKDQLADFVNEKFEGKANGFFTREEQLMKLVALIQQPGLITPSSAERAMQIANTAKLNSGCISRKVGATVTDSEYFVRAVGWNDVAKGHTPCNLRTVTDFLDGTVNLNDSQHYSKFEKGAAIDESAFKYKGDNPGNFKDALVDYFKEAHELRSGDLNGKNCSFCFKTVHNHYEGEANQVHTRSLHAEENAMLQITKLGGGGVSGGYLFTTASPCELCSKKAYQLGIKKIFFIDPYPGIAVDQILKGGKETSQPQLIPFSGAIGNAYHELYECFMSYKDEVSMTLELKPKQKLAKEITNILNRTRDKEITEFLKDTKLDDTELIDLVKTSIRQYKAKGEAE
ncbi:MAG TPA: hypothetical protein VK492_01490 [Chitinophagaceae bacterium]|nr:hypothetical protein [Chitinophagaceae bacterium]